MKVLDLVSDVVSRYCWSVAAQKLSPRIRLSFGMTRFQQWQHTSSNAKSNLKPNPDNIHPTLASIKPEFAPYRTSTEFNPHQDRSVALSRCQERTEH